MRLLHARTVRPGPSAAINTAAAKAAQTFLLGRVPGSRRGLGLAVSTIGVALGTSTLAALAPGVAQASPPVGTCTKSYAELTYEQAGMLPDPVQAQAAFMAVNANGDAYVCYKPYPNGPHNGHYGNFVDNTAAPHQ
jgi:hypothetical protein